MTSDTASFATLIATIERGDDNSKESLREIIRLLCKRLESDIGLFSKIELNVSTLFQSLSESLAISGQWLLGVLKNKPLISLWGGEWINFINSLEMLNQFQYIPLYSKTIWMRNYLQAENFSSQVAGLRKLEDYLSISNSVSEIHKLYFEFYLASLTGLNEMPQY